MSPGCTNCYAEKMSHRNPAVLGEWGPGAKRVLASESYWRQPFKWNRDAAAAGERRRVFCASLGDVGDAEVPNEWRRRLLVLAWNTIYLDWLFLTKRIAEFRAYLIDRQHRGVAKSFPNVWVGTSVEDRKALARVDVLRVTPAAVRFLSVEPLLEDLGVIDLTGIDWVIAGGESGPHARPCDARWISSIVAQCKAAGVPVFVKQIGANPVHDLGDGHRDRTASLVRAVTGIPLTDRKGGDWNEWPEDLRVREYPEARP